MTEFPFSDNVLPGVAFKLLKSHHDQRGFFREVLRVSDPIFTAGRFAQWSHSSMQKDVVKAWHYHNLQYDWWYVPLGQIEAVLVDFREESPVFRKKIVLRMGDRALYGSDTWEVCVRIPPGVLHGCRVLSPQAHLFYITSETYSTDDEGRLPFDSKEVQHSWGPGALTAENDRRVFVPARPRNVLASQGVCPVVDNAD